MIEDVRRTDSSEYTPDLVALAPVQPGRVTPRTVLQGDGARVVVLAMDTGTEMKEHQTPHPLLIQALDGHVRITTEDDGFDLRPGALLHLAASVPHAVHAVEPSRLSLTLLLGTAPAP